MRFLWKALTGGAALAALTALVWLGAAPYLACLPGGAALPGARCVLTPVDGPGAAERGEPAFPVTSAVLRSQTATPVLTAFGEVRSGRTWEIRVDAPGRLVAVADGFRDGGFVAEGTLLLKVDPADPASRRADAAEALAEAEAEAADAERALALSRSELDAAKAQRALRRRLLERQKTLVDRRITAETAVEEAELALTEAERSVIARSQAVAAAERRATQSKAQVARAEIALEDAARALEETRIVAPFSGVLRLDADMEAGAGATLGRLVQQNDKLGALIDLQAMEAWFRVSDAEFSRLLDAEGRLAALPATATLALGDRAVTAPAELTRVSATATPGEGGRRVYARLSVGPETLLRPGDFVTVSIEEPPLSEIAVVPAAAVEGDARLFVIRADDRLEAAPIRVLRRMGDQVVVTGRDGPPPWGARYVTALTPRLAAGVKVLESALGGRDDAPSAPEPASASGDGGSKAREQAAEGPMREGVR